jgi:tetratricopeptide (TPR) repeat protein
MKHVPDVRTPCAADGPAGCRPKRPFFRAAGAALLVSAFALACPHAPSPQSLQYLNKGFNCAINRDYAEARASYDSAISLDPNCTYAYIAKGNVYSDESNSDSAIAAYTIAIRLGSTDPYAFNNRGIAYFRKGDLDRAKADYEAAIKLGSAAACINLGTLYFSQGNTDLAYQHYRDGLARDPTESYACNGRTLIMKSLPPPEQ